MRLGFIRGSVFGGGSMVNYGSNELLSYFLSVLDGTEYLSCYFSI